MRLIEQWRRGGPWFGPSWAMLCGVAASSQFGWSAGNVILVLVALLLAGGLWPALWAALAETDWATPLSHWRGWHDGAPLRPLPYAQPGSPAAHLAVVLGQLRDWASRDLLPGYGGALAVCIAAPVAALILSAILGEPAMLLTVAAILLPQLALPLCRGSGRPSVLLRGLVEVTLPMLLGFALFMPLRAEVAVAAVGFGVSVAGAGEGAWDTRPWNLGQAVVVALMVLMRHPMGAFLAVVLWLPQFLLQTRSRAAREPVRRARWWLMASMLATAYFVGR